MRTRVKVCGITSRDELDAVVAAGVDAVGFVTEVPVDTHRKLTRKETRELVKATPPFVTTVAVTMPDDDENAAALAREPALLVLDEPYDGLDVVPGSTYSA
ncbi:MAG: hypothetical protein ACOCRA_05375 [Halobacteria archaeon]